MNLQTIYFSKLQNTDKRDIETYPFNLPYTILMQTTPNFVNTNIKFNNVLFIIMFLLLIYYHIFFFVNTKINMVIITVF